MEHPILTAYVTCGFVAYLHSLSCLGFKVNFSVQRYFYTGAGSDYLFLLRNSTALTLNNNHNFTSYVNQHSRQIQLDRCI
jgi:hypothetical protein